MRSMQAFLAALASLWCAPYAEAQSTLAETEDPDQIDRMDISPAEDRVTIPISIAGKGPWPFIIDTGAQRTVIARDLADRLALVRGGSVTVLGMAGPARADTVALPSLGYGQSSVEDIQAPVLERAHLGAPGLLGLDGLQSKRLLLDFRSGRIQIARSRPPRRSGGDEDLIVVEARRRNGQLILLDSRINGLAVNIILDTGTNVSVGNMALMTRLMAKKRLPMLHQATLTSVTGGTVTGPVGVIDSVRMGAVTLKDVAILFADAAPFAELKLQEKPALLLGINALKVFDRVAIDFGTAKVDFLLPDLGGIERSRYAATGRAG